MLMKASDDTLLYTILSDASFCRAVTSVTMHLITIYDVENKFIAYTGPVPEVAQILCEWGSVYCLTSDGKVG